MKPDTYMTMAPPAHPQFWARVKARGFHVLFILEEMPSLRMILLPSAALLGRAGEAEMAASSWFAPCPVGRWRPFSHYGIPLIDE